MTEVPTILAYTIVVSRESARISLTLFDLYDIVVKTPDITNIYLIASVYERKKVTADVNITDELSLHKG